MWGYIMSDLEKYRTEELAKAEGGNLKTYIFGFAISIILTLVAYFFAVDHVFSGFVLITVLLELAILQFAAQLFLFLHLGQKRGRGWRLLTIVLMLVFVLIVVMGSIWIMSQLNYNMSPSQVTQWMHQQSLESF